MTEDDWAELEPSGQLLGARTRASLCGVLLGRGNSVDTVVQVMLERDGTGSCTALRRRCLDWIVANPDRAELLPEKLKADFVSRRDRAPRFVYVAAWHDGSEWSGWLVGVRAPDSKEHKEKPAGGWSFSCCCCPPSPSLRRPGRGRCKT